MKNNEWSTIKILMSMEHEKMIKNNSLNVENLNRAYFLWCDKVERHIHITEDTESITDQEREIMAGFVQSHDVPKMTHEEIEVLTRMFRAMRRAN